MKYFTEDIEFTRSRDYFSEDGFLLNGVCYDKVILTKKYKKQKREAHEQKK